MPYMSLSNVNKKEGRAASGRERGRNVTDISSSDGASDSVFKHSAVPSSPMYVEVP